VKEYMTDLLCGKRLVASALSFNHISAACIPLATDLRILIAFGGSNQQVSRVSGGSSMLQIESKHENRYFEPVRESFGACQPKPVGYHRSLIEAVTPGAVRGGQRSSSYAQHGAPTVDVRCTACHRLDYVLMSS
jgi:hypothetical protein